MTGWPNDRPTCLLLFWDFRDEIGVQGSILLKSDKIIIPTSLPRGILREFHALNLGVEKNSVEDTDSSIEEKNE